MTEEESFVRHIRAQPQDEFPRLVYADYLEDRGDPRGEFIRLQCELARGEPDDPQRPAMEAREQELLAEHGEGWLTPLRELGAIGISARCFRGGLIERVRIEAAAMIAGGQRLCAIAPALHWIELRGVREAVDGLARMDLPPQVHAVDISSNRLGPAEIARLKSARWLGPLEQLHADFNQIGSEGVAELLSVAWPRLRVLSLGRNGIEGPAARGAIAAASLPALATLSLALNPLGPAGAEALAAATLPNLVELDLAATAIEAAGATALAESAGWRSLQRLNLRNNRIGGGAIRALVQAGWALTSLDLRGNSLRPNELRTRYGEALLI